MKVSSLRVQAHVSAWVFMLFAGCTPGFHSASDSDQGFKDLAHQIGRMHSQVAALSPSESGASGWGACTHEPNTTTYRSCYVVLELKSVPDRQAVLAVEDEAGAVIYQYGVGVVADVRVGIWIPDSNADDIRKKPVGLVLKDAATGAAIASAPLRSVVLSNPRGAGSGNDVLYDSATWTDQNWGRVLSDAVLSRQGSQGPLSITSSVAMAGAFGSLKLNGHEYVSTGGHGASLQFATYPLRTATDYPTECYNPTEAGNQEDDRDMSGFTGADNSTSYLHEFEMRGAVLRAVSNIAWYTPIGAVSGWAGQCENRAITWPMGNKEISGYWLTKETSLSKYAGIDNVVSIDATITVPENLDRFQLGLAHYTPTDFSRLFSYDPANDRLIELGVTDSDYAYTERSDILIVSSFYLNHAYAVSFPGGYDTITPVLKDPKRVWIWGEMWNKPGYDFGDYRIHSSMFFFKSMAAGSSAKLSLDIVVGGIEKVRQTMRQLAGAQTSNGARPAAR